MVNVCANPKCSKPLHYLRDGRIFVFDVASAQQVEGARPRQLEHHWLCGDCCDFFTMTHSADTGAVLKPRAPVGLRAVGTVKPMLLPERLAS